MNVILITETYASNFNISDIADSKDSSIVVDNINYLHTIKKLNTIKNTPIIIYDITTIKKTNNKHPQTYNVTDHINLTGHNPLMGNQQHIQKPFFDISNLYIHNKKQTPVVTHCLGNKYETEKNNFTFPSTYLCHLSIMARATGKTKISAFLTGYTK